jgi:hypothetical protein
VNGGLPVGGNYTIDSGSGALTLTGNTVTLGAGATYGTVVSITSPNPNNFAAYVTGWTLQTDPTGNMLQLTLTAPEPHHLLLICAGALFLVMTIRRRWQSSRNASVA